MARDTIRVEVAYGEPERQKIVALTMYAGATLAEAVERSGLVRFFPHLKEAALDYGIFGTVRPASTILADGDRVEIYRPLIADPREMRRLRAKNR